MKNFILLFCLTVLFAGTGNAQDFDSFKILSPPRSVLSTEAVTILASEREWQKSDGSKIGVGVGEVISKEKIKIVNSDGSVVEARISALREADRDLIIEAIQFKQVYTFAPVGNSGIIRIRYDFPLIPILENRTRNCYGFFNVAYRENGVPQELTAGYIKVDGKTVRVEVTSSDEEVIKIVQQERLAGTGYRFRFKREGLCFVKVRVGDEAAIVVPIKVKALRVKIGDPAGKIVEAYGLPDSKKTHFIKWPNAETHDEIPYVPTARQSSISALHWRFEKMFPVVISVVDSRVYAAGWDSIGINTFVKEQSLWYKGGLDHIFDSATEPNQQLLVAKAGKAMENLVEDSQEEPDPRFELRVWNDISGKHSIEAVYAGRAGKKITLTKEDGTTILLREDRLSIKDQEYLKNAK